MSVSGLLVLPEAVNGGRGEVCRDLNELVGIDESGHVTRVEQFSPIRFSDDLMIGYKLFCVVEETESS